MAQHSDSLTCLIHPCETRISLYLESNSQMYAILTRSSHRIRDANAAIELIHEKLEAPSGEIKELQQHETELKSELEEETKIWHSRWPEQEECCMILKLELDRTQAELNATYQKIERQFGGMDHSKAEKTLIDIEPCPIFKGEEREPDIEMEFLRNLFALEDEFPEEFGDCNINAVDMASTSLLDLVTDSEEEEVPSTSKVQVESNNPGVLVDLCPESPAVRRDGKGLSTVPRTFNDLAVLITDFPILSEEKRRIENRVEESTSKDIGDVVQVLSEGFKQVIQERFEESDTKLKDKEKKLEGLRKEKDLMGPLFGIGLAIRQRHVEVESRKEHKDKDIAIIAKGNSAAHHAQVLADATWMMVSPNTQEVFKEIYSGVDAEIVWEHKELTAFLDILNWNRNMGRFQVTGGLDRKTFDRLFNVVFPMIYPALKITDEDVENNANLKEAVAGMRLEHTVAYERERRTRADNRFFLKNGRPQASKKMRSG
jgi:hypothetical protein